MIKRDKRTLKDGTVKTYIRVTQGYRPYPKAEPKQRTIKSFGYEEDQEDIEAFWKAVNECNARVTGHKKDETDPGVLSVMMYDEGNRPLNYGYKFLESVYKMLSIEDFIKNFEKTSGFRGKYSINEILTYLTVDRVINQSSKRGAVAQAINYYGLRNEWDLKDVYRALDQFDKFFYSLQTHLNNKVYEITGRQLKNSFYDVTNYYLEKDFPGPDEDYIDRYGKIIHGPALGQKGVSKERKTSPIIQMGLFIDDNAIPVCMDVFPGNTSECTIFKEHLNELKCEYGIKRTVVVADKGINSSSNIDLICSQGDGYVFSQIIKGKRGKRYHSALFEQEGWEWSDDHNYKWKLFEEEYWGNEISYRKENGGNVESKKRVKRKRKVLLYWSKADCEMAIKKRQDKLERAKKAVENNVYNITKGKERYIEEQTTLKETGEILDKTKIKKIHTVDEEKAEEDAKFDGYFAIVTSELHYDAQKIRCVYHGLWKIEESFRIMKSDFDARPIFVRKRAHIRAHFLSCYVALVIVRLIQHYMGADRISAHRIGKALRASVCLQEKGGYVRLLDVGGVLSYVKKKGDGEKDQYSLTLDTNDEVASDFRVIQKVFGTNFYSAYAKQETLKQFFQNMKLENKKA